MERYSNGYDSDYTCHSSNSSKKLLNEVIFRFSSCLLIRLPHQVIFRSVPGLPKRVRSSVGYSCLKCHFLGNFNSQLTRTVNME
jgi:hypothetical protein